MVIRLMKNFLTVLFIFSSKLAFPFEKFGGVYFDRTVPNSQAYAMKEDLKYLFKTDVLSFDTDLLKLLGTNDTSGETLYNWVYNRVRYIIGESYTIGGQNYISRGLLLSGFRYPKTPLPVIDRGDEYGASVVMSNVGASLYYNGKKQNELQLKSNFAAEQGRQRKMVRAWVSLVVPGPLPSGHGARRSEARFLAKLAFRKLPCSLSVTWPAMH